MLLARGGDDAGFSDDGSHANATHSGRFIKRARDCNLQRKPLATTLTTRNDFRVFSLSIALVLLPLDLPPSQHRNIYTPPTHNHDSLRYITRTPCLPHRLQSLDHEARRRTCQAPLPTPTLLTATNTHSLLATMPETTKVVPLTCHGHSRPVPHIHFSSIVDEDQFYIISACKDGNPMLRDGVTGDWIGTFLGHKGAVWQARLSSDASLAATASADFSA